MTSVVPVRSRGKLAGSLNGWAADRGDLPTGLIPLGRLFPLRSGFPILANLDLHFVMDPWIRKVVSKRCKGRALFRRYADERVVCFERKEDARADLHVLPKRLGKFRLRLAATAGGGIAVDSRVASKDRKCMIKTNNKPRTGVAPAARLPRTS